MTLEGVDASARAFIRGAWPLCLIAMFNWWRVTPGSSPYDVFIFLYGFAGCLVFLRGFGLTTSLPIYCLTLAILFTVAPAENETAQLQAILNLEPSAYSYLWEFVTAFKSALMALPFSLFFFDRMGGYATLVKIPLCVFFLVLSIEPTLLILALSLSGI